MATFNPEVDYGAELKRLRLDYVEAPPQHRYNIILRRLAHEEIGPVGLCTAVSAVEALARAVVVAHQVKAGTPQETAYKTARHRNAQPLIEDALLLLGKPAAATRFPEDTWPLFNLAVDFRNLVMHECTYLGGDKTNSLIAAAREVLQGLADDAGLHA